MPNLIHALRNEITRLAKWPATDPFWGGAMGQPTFPRRFRPAPAR